MSSTVEENEATIDSQTDPTETEVNKIKEPTDQENPESEEIVDVNSMESGSEYENHEGAEERFRGDSVVSIPEITLPEYIKHPDENVSSSSSFLKNIGFISCRMLLLNTISST